MSSLQFDHVHLRYGRTEVLRDLSLSMASGEIGCLLGASGCGKTSALRALAGFEPLSAGRLLIDDEVVSSAQHLLPPQQRRIGMVFQDFALFGHLSVAENIGFGLKQGPARLSAAERAGRIDEMLELIGLADQARKMPHQLSGGQQQRVALARALAPRPRLMLLDEPFSSLDSELRERLALEVRALLKATGTTALLVTHDQHEAFAMADRVGMMQDGRLEQWAAPYELYHQPASRAVAQFVGESVLLRVGADTDGRIDFGADFAAACCCESTFRLSSAQLALRNPAGQIDLLVRPDDVTHDDASPVQAEVLAKAFRGAQFLYRLRLKSGREVLALVPSHHDHAIGEWIGISLSLDHVMAFQA